MVRKTLLIDMHRSSEKDLFAQVGFSVFEVEGHVLEIHLP